MRAVRRLIVSDRRGRHGGRRHGPLEHATAAPPMVAGRPHAARTVHDSGAEPPGTDSDGCSDACERDQNRNGRRPPRAASAQFPRRVRRRAGLWLDPLGQLCGADVAGEKLRQCVALRLGQPHRQITAHGIPTRSTSLVTWVLPLGGGIDAKSVPRRHSSGAVRAAVERSGWCFTVRCRAQPAARRTGAEETGRCTSTR
jgi:hypothetical protein